LQGNGQRQLKGEQEGIKAKGKRTKSNFGRK